MLSPWDLDLNFVGWENKQPSFFLQRVFTFALGVGKLEVKVRGSRVAPVKQKAMRKPPFLPLSLAFRSAVAELFYLAKQYEKESYLLQVTFLPNPGAPHFLLSAQIILWNHKK